MRSLSLLDSIWFFRGFFPVIEEEMAASAALAVQSVLTAVVGFLC